ncbi:hypothetical protein FBU31_000233, partial [Coemansia sp. 'formosensis']
MITKGQAKRKAKKAVFDKAKVEFKKPADSSAPEEPAPKRPAPKEPAPKRTAPSDS